MKRTALLLTMVVVLAMVFAFSGCSSLDATLTQGTFLEGTAIEDFLFETYTINFVVNGETTAVPCKQGLVPAAPAVEDYETDAAFFTFTGWDKEIVAATENATYTAVFSSTAKKYDVTFVYGGTEGSTVELEWGATPTAPTTGLDYQTADKVYTFKGWDKEIVAVNGDAVYTAQYDEAAREYDVTFTYGNPANPTTVTSKVAYGTVPTAPADVAGYQTADKIYSFKGWDKDVVAVKGDVTYTAQYNSVVRKYDITFIYGEPNDLKTVTSQVAYGLLPTAPADIASWHTTEKTYTFKAWDKELANVTGEATYTAVYEESARKYDITFVFDGKTEVVGVEYGATVTLPAPAGYTVGSTTFTFKGWDKAAAAVAGEDTYTALYNVAVTGTDLYSQNFNDKDFDRNSLAARYNEVLDTTWTLNLMAGGAYAKTVVDPANANNKYVLVGLLATNNGASAQLNAKDATKKGAIGSLAYAGDATKITFSVDLAKKADVAVAKSYIRLRSKGGGYVYLLQTFSDGTVQINRETAKDAEGNEVVVTPDDVAITTTMQQFTFQIDVAAGTLTLLVDGVQKYTGNIKFLTKEYDSMSAFVKDCTEYLFNWAFEKYEGENALCIDNLSIVAHN